MSRLERIVKFEAGYDERHTDPDKNYGVHGVNIRFLVKGEAGAVQFLLYTGWYPTTAHIADAAAYPADLGYHSRLPRYDGQTRISESCELLDGAPCYYDGSALNAQRLFDVLRDEGDTGVWRELEDYYNRRLL